MMCTRRFSARASLDDAQCLNAGEERFLRVRENPARPESVRSRLGHHRCPENQHRISLEHVACLPLHSPHPQHLSPARPLWTRVSSRLAPSYPSFSHPARLFLLLSAAARRPVPAVREAPVAGEPPSLRSPRSHPRLDGWAVALTTRDTSEMTLWAVLHIPFPTSHGGRLHTGLHVTLQQSEQTDLLEVPPAPAPEMRQCHLNPLPSGSRPLSGIQS